METKSMVKELAVLSEVAGNLRRQTEGDTDSVQDDFDYAHILLDNSPKPKVIQPTICDAADNLNLDCGDCQKCD